MYGEARLNRQAILMYGLTKEFFDAFSSLKYLGIELPYALQFQYMKYIKSIVEKNLNNKALIHRFQKKYGLRNMKQVQRALAKNPRVTRDLSKVPHRKAILMPGRFASTAIKAFPHHQVILIILSKKDQDAIKGKTLPSNVAGCNFKKIVSKTKISKRKKRSFKLRINSILRRQRRHIVFRNPSFKKWLCHQWFSYMRYIHALDELYRKYPIGVIVHYTSLLNIGIIQALLAKKYRLPFVQCALELVTDNYLIPSRATHHCVWGKHFADWLKKRGVPSSKISIVGNPRFDHEIQRKYMNPKLFRKKLKIPAQHYIFSFMTQPFPFKKNINILMIQWMNRSIQHLLSTSDTRRAKSLPITFLIKKHPSDQEKHYNHSISFPNIKIVPNHFHLYDVLHSSDFVMTISSNSAIEAVMHKKGLITLQPNLPYHYEFNYNQFHAHLAKASAGFVARNSSQLCTYTKLLIEEQKARDSLVHQGQLFMKDTILSSRNSSELIGKVIKRYVNQ